MKHFIVNHSFIVIIILLLTPLSLTACSIQVMNNNDESNQVVEVNESESQLPTEEPEVQLDENNEEANQELEEPIEPEQIKGIVALMYSSNSLEVKKDANKASETIGSQGNGEEVTIVDITDAWIQIEFQEETGWVPNQSIWVDAQVDASIHPEDALMLKNIPDGTQQVILSLVDDTTGTVRMYEQIDNKWYLTFGPVDAVMGKNGPGKEKEGDKKTPIGTFFPDIAFGIPEAIDGVNFNYKQMKPDSVWVGDISSQLYNQWDNYVSGQADYNLKQCEVLLDYPVVYKYALNYGYNPNNTPSVGSALFLHVWRANNSPTLGCTAIAEDYMLTILKMLDENKQPAFMQYSISDVLAINN